MIVTTLKYVTDLNSGLTMTPLRNAFLTGDEEAHRFEVRCYRGSESISLDGAVVTGYFIRPDGVTLPIPGTVEDNAAVVQLPAACYVHPGRFSLVVKAAVGDTISSILWAEGAVSRSKTDDVRDPLENVPSLDDLLAQIGRLEQAITKAETVANLTAEATTLAAGSQATAEYKDGKVTLGIPRGADGLKGDPGYTPVKGVDYFDGKDGYTPVKGKDYFDGAKGDPGYTPVKGVDYFDGKDGYTPVKGKDYCTPADQEAIVQQVIAALGTPVYGRVEANKTILLSSTNLPDGAYTLAFDNADGSKTELCKLELSGGNAGPGVAYHNLLVPSTCVLNQRINSSGQYKDTNADNAFITDYIDIGDCLAKGGINQIHFRGFHIYKLSGDSITGDTYRGIHYYDSDGNFLGQYCNYYVEPAVTDENGDYVITLDATKTTATKIRIQGAIAGAILTSTDQLADCIITLNELITDEPVVTYTNLVPTSLTHTDLSTVFNNTGYMDGAYASSSSPFYGSDSATVCMGCIPVAGGDVFYIKGITLDASVNSHCRVGIGQKSATNNGINVSAVKGIDSISDYATLETLGDQYYKLTIKADYVSANLTRQPYIFISGIGTGANLIVTANEPIV